MRLFLKGINKILGRYQKNRQGFVLILTLMLISLLSVLAITSFELVTATTRITRNHKLYTQALYSADAGIEHTFYVLNRADMNGDWSGITWGNPSTLYSLSMDNHVHTNDQVSGTWEWVPVTAILPDDWVPGWVPFNGILPDHLWKTTPSFEASNNYSVKVYIRNDPADRRIYVESRGKELGFEKFIQAEIENSQVRITRWMEREM